MSRVSGFPNCVCCVEYACGAGIRCCSLVHDFGVGAAVWEGEWWDGSFRCGEEGLGDGSPVSVWVDGDWNEDCVSVEEVFDDGFSGYDSECVGGYVSNCALVSHILPFLKILQM